MHAAAVGPPLRPDRKTFNGDGGATGLASRATVGVNGDVAVGKFTAAKRAVSRAGAHRWTTSS